jgi:hypothetical protein
MCNLSYRGFCRVSKLVAYVRQKIEANITMLDKQEGKKGWSAWFAKTHVRDSMLGTNVLEQKKVQKKSS